MGGMALLAGSPALANPLTDCFERIAVAARHVPHPHARPAHPPVNRVHHVGPRRHRAHKVVVAGAAAAYAHRTHYVTRPRACGTNEAMMTPVAVGAPEALELLLAELVGPPVAAASPASPELTESGLMVLPQGPGVETSEFSGGPGGSPGGFISSGGGGPGGPGQPPVGPGQPPVTPPPVLPPDTPPTGGPPVMPPPPILPPDQPPVTPPPVLPPVTPPTLQPPGGPGGGVPEPATWAMLTVGFFGLGGALRRRRAHPA